MAYDKVVDSSVLDAGLKQIADAIREKTGSTDGLTLDDMAEAIAAIEAGGADVSQFGFTKAVFGTTVGSQSFVHNLGETPRCVLFWSDDVYSYVDLNSAPQQFLRAGIGIVITGVSGTKEVVESYVSCSKAGSQKFSISPPSASCPRSGFDVYYAPTTTNSGVVMTTTYNADHVDDKNTIFVRGKIASGHTYRLNPTATYYWGVFA